MRKLPLLIVLVFPLAAACHVQRHAHYEPPYPDATLKTTVDTEDRQVHYKVRAGDNGSPTIDRVDTRQIAVAQLGLHSSPVDNKTASERGLSAWRGVLVDSFAADSAAQAAGFAPGDVLLALDDIELVSVDQLREVIGSALAPERSARARVLRRQADGSWTELALTVTPKAKRVGETTIDSFALASNAELKRRTGLEVATVPADLALELWNKEASAALVASVVSGSAGYRGGLRRGDVIERCNGQVVRDVADLAAALESGARQLELEVTGRLGAHRATITADDDILRKSEFSIPIVLHHASSVSHSETSFLDFILQFGFNKRRTSYASPTRAPREHESLSILPFGMFEFKRTPESDRTTLFWFITWSTKH